MRPLLYVFVPLSLLTFTILAWNDRGERATTSWRTVSRFYGSFYRAVATLTVGYTAAAFLGAVAIALIDFF